MTSSYFKVLSPRGILLFAPHPDDDVLSCSVLLQRTVDADIPIHIVFLTSGDANPWPMRYFKRSWRISKTDAVHWAERRQKEACASLAAIGIPESRVQFLRWPDLGITDLLMSGSDAPLATLQEIVARTNAGTIIVPALSDLHPDHSAAAVLLELIRERISASDLEQRWWWYLVHKPDSVDVAADIDTVATEREVENKRSGIAHHETQMLLSSKRFLSFAQIPEKFYDSPEPRTFPFALVRLSNAIVFDRPEPRFARLFPRRIFIRGNNGATQKLVIPAGKAAPREIALGKELSLSARIFFKYEFRPIFRDYSGWTEVRSSRA